MLSHLNGVATIEGCIVEALASNARLRNSRGDVSWIIDVRALACLSAGRKSFNGTFLPDSSTLRRYCCHDPATRIYRTDQGDEQAGLVGNAAADGDNLLIRSNGTDLEASTPWRAVVYSDVMPAGLLPLGCHAFVCIASLVRINLAPIKQRPRTE
jgi:hypothetical protein